MRHLRIMFQGGGARVVVLLAAAEALQQIESENAVKIVGVAGVSAGSIAAAALAGEHAAADVRRRFAKAGRLFVERQRKGLKKLQRRPSLTSGTTLLMINDMVSGNTILSRSALRRVLRGTFPDGANGKPATLAETKVPLTVFVSNLRTGHSEPLDRQRHEHLTVVDALARSVSLPFVFSTFETGEETDGGICGNLPISYFGADGDSDAKILALHFPEELIEFSDAIGYARALLMSAMNASVREAMDQTKKYGGLACEIPTEGIGTFAFTDALSLAEDEARYALLVARLKPILLKKIDALFGAPPITEVSHKRYVSHPMVKVHDGLRRDFPCKKILSAQAQIHGDVRPALPSGGVQSDKLLMTCQYIPADDNRRKGLRAIRQGLPFGSISLPLFNIRIYDKDDCEVPHAPELLSFPNGDRIENRVLIFLDEIVDEDRCPIELRIGFEFDGALTRLKKRGLDASRSYAATEGRQTQRIWLLATPGNLPVSFTDLMESEMRDVPEEWHAEMDLMRGRWSPGSQLVDKVARTHFGRLFSEPLVEGAQIGGWNVPEFRKDTYCGFTVTRRN